MQTSPQISGSELQNAGQARILLLAGTAEAAQLAANLAALEHITVISSYAGRVNVLRTRPGLVRIGGFGGIKGLAAYLAQERIDVVIDATHPFAANISRNAEAACTQTNVPLIALSRSAWTPMTGDRWQEFYGYESAAAFVDKSYRRVFLSIGRQEISAFSACIAPWFLIRCIEPPDHVPMHSQVILERGPFALEDELALFRRHSIDCIVSKNSGGVAMYAKIEAARILQVPVVMIQRPAKHTHQTVATLEEAIAQLDALLATAIPAQGATNP